MHTHDSDIPPTLRDPGCATEPADGPIDLSPAEPESETVEGYEIRDGRVSNPGKFEGEPRWVPAMWAHVLDGCSESLDYVEGDPSYERIDLTADDLARFPELAEMTDLGNGVRAVVLWEDDSGFVRGADLADYEPPDDDETNDDEPEYGGPFPDSGGDDCLSESDGSD